MPDGPVEVGMHTPGGKHGRGWRLDGPAKAEFKLAGLKTLLAGKHALGGKYCENPSNNPLKSARGML
jgi:hypothetical protein